MEYFEIDYTSAVEVEERIVPTDEAIVEWEDDIPVVVNAPTYPEFADFGE